ncbi:MAG: hypothetical protein CBD94_01700 [Gammaproteobacteria bacterium TMED234]|nr:MAG: hypothetical protein CBD94_01700 [Gammaproteobacteria bacterium TMED234]
MAQTLTQQQIRVLAEKAGFSPQNSNTIAAVCKSESAGFAGAHNPDASMGDNSYGLCQINMLGAMGPERRAKFGISSNEELKDPLTNLKAAKRVFDEEGFGAWSDYKNKRYEKHLPSGPAMNQSNASASDKAMAALGQNAPAELVNLVAAREKLEKASDNSYDNTSSNGSSNLPQAQPGREVNGALGKLNEASSALNQTASPVADNQIRAAVTQLFQQAAAPGLSKEQTDRISAPRERLDEPSNTDILLKLFKLSQKNSEEAADQRMFESFMNKSKGAISDAVQYKMGKSVL